MLHCAAGLKVIDETFADKTPSHLFLAAEQNDGPGKSTIKDKPGAKTSSGRFYCKTCTVGEPGGGTCVGELLLLQELQKQTHLI